MHRKLKKITMILTMIFTITLLICSTTIGRANIRVYADTLPPMSVDESLVGKLDSMSLSDLQSQALPLPTNDYKVLHGIAMQPDATNFPEDNKIYYQANTFKGNTEQDFYRFLYVKPKNNYSGSLIVALYRWCYYNGKFDATPSGVLKWEGLNYTLYDALLKAEPVVTPVLPSTTPPDQDLLDSLKDLSVNQLNAISSDMPANALGVTEHYATSGNRTIALENVSLFPQDGNVYTYKNSHTTDDKTNYQDTYFYKLLYVTPISNDSFGTLNYTFYKWHYEQNSKHPDAVTNIFSDNELQTDSGVVTISGTDPRLCTSLSEGFVDEAQPSDIDILQTPCTQPPTPTEISNLNNVSLKAVGSLADTPASTVPTEACRIMNGVITLGDLTKFPQDNKIYTLYNEAGTTFYKLLYAEPVQGSTTGEIKFTLFKWDFDRLDITISGSNGVITGTGSDVSLYNKLVVEHAKTGLSTTDSIIK